MSAEAITGEPRVPFAPLLRGGRILWRLVPWLGTGAVLLVAAFALDASDPIRRQAIVVAGALAAYALLTSLVAEMLSPNRAALRMVPISDQRAEQFAFAARILLFFLLVTELGQWLVAENDWRPSVAALLGVTRDAVLVLLLASVLSLSGLLRRMRQAPESSLWGAFQRVVARWIVPLAVLTALFLVIARGLGYRPLAAYVLQGAIRTSVKLVLAALVFRYGSRGIQRALRFMRPAASNAEDASGSLQDAHPAALGTAIIATGLWKLAIAIATVLWILAGWGQSPEELVDSLSSPIFGQGGVTWGQMIGGIADVGVVLFVGWLLKNILVFFVFPRSKVDVGARYAILAMLRYVIVALALILGLGALGIETGSLGWFFGAAGIGLGLGLQDIIGNFFGGLIMLLQRPIRVGDIVSVAEASGTVEDIRMRGTTLRTFDNTTVLIPNRQLLGSRIQNLTHAMGHTRIRIDLGVSYDADPERVRTVLLETASAHEKIVDDPAPSVIFQGYGASSLDFSLFCYTRELRSRIGIASEIRYAVFRRFKKEGIEIPFPQQVVHYKGTPPAAPGDPRPAKTDQAQS
jgi:small-conductance mechanosensitive channel